MENAQPTTPPTPTPVVSSPQPQVNKKDPFSLIGKVVIVLVIVALLVGGGYVLATKFGMKKDLSMQKAAPTQVANVPIATSVPVATASPIIATKKTVKAGLTNGSTSFKPYSIEIPIGWTDTRDKTDITDKLTITKGKYSLAIYQAPIGGGGCTYKGDPPAQMAQSFSEFVGITGTSAQYKRSWNTSGNPAGTISHTVCQKGTDGSFGSPTSFGAISIKTPNVTDDKTLTEIDGMIASIAQ